VDLGTLTRKLWSSIRLSCTLSFFRDYVDLILAKGQRLLPTYTHTHTHLRVLHSKRSTPYKMAAPCINAFFLICTQTILIKLDTFEPTGATWALTAHVCFLPEYSRKREIFGKRTDEFLSMFWLGVSVHWPALLLRLPEVQGSNLKPSPAFRRFSSVKRCNKVKSSWYTPQMAGGGRGGMAPTLS
jgi:hypothetical protein